MAYWKTDVTIVLRDERGERLATITVDLAATEVRADTVQEAKRAAAEVVRLDFVKNRALRSALMTDVTVNAYFDHV